MKLPPVHRRPKRRAPGRRLPRAQLRVVRDELRNGSVVVAAVHSVDQGRTCFGRSGSTLATHGVPGSSPCSRASARARSTRACSSGPRFILAIGTLAYWLRGPGRHRRIPPQPGRSHRCPPSRRPPHGRPGRARPKPAEPPDHRAAHRRHERALAPARQPLAVQDRASSWSPCHWRYRRPAVASADPTCSALSSGKSATISSEVTPGAMVSMASPTAIRVPTKQGLPRRTPRPRLYEIGQRHVAHRRPSPHHTRSVPLLNCRQIGRAALNPIAPVAPFGRTARPV